MCASLLLMNDNRRETNGEFHKLLFVVITIDEKIHLGVWQFSKRFVNYSDRLNLDNTLTEIFFCLTFRFSCHSFIKKNNKVKFSDFHLPPDPQLFFCWLVNIGRSHFIISFIWVPHNISIDSDYVGVYDPIH